jgi:hypothetical protein
MSGLRFLPYTGPDSDKSFIIVSEAPQLIPGMPGILGMPGIGIPGIGIPGIQEHYPYKKSSKKHKKHSSYGVAPIPPFSPILSPGISGIPVIPGIPGIPVLSPAHVVPGMPGAFIVASPAPPTPPVTPPPVTPPPPATTATSYTVVTPPITNVRHITSPDADPELRRKVVKHFYNQLKDVYFLDKFKKLFKYIVVENGSARLVKSYEELQKNANNYNDSKLKISFITDNIFSKYDLEVLISKLIAKYSMLYSDDEYNMHWYTAKYKHARIVKKAMYKKIKYRLQKKVNF